MNFKKTLLIGVIFGLSVLGVVLLNKQDKKNKEIEESEAKLLNVEKEKFTSVALYPLGIHAVKTGEEWKLIEPFETDADKSAIEAILNIFSWAKIERTVSSDQMEYTDFGLNPEYGKMVLTYEGGADTLYIGDSNPTGSFLFARRGGSDVVFLTTTSLRTQLEKSLFDYRDKRALVFNKDQVTAFDIKTSKNTYSLAKNGAQWDLLSPLEDKADDGKVQGVINRIANTRIKEFVDENPKSLATYGLLKPNYTIDVFIGSEKAKKTLYIGNAKAKQFYAKDETRKPVFLLDSSFVNIFKAPVSDYRNKKITDFKEADIARFELNYSDTTIVCTKDSNGKWVLVEPVKNKTKSWKISAITSAVANLRVEKFVDKKRFFTTIWFV